MRKPVHPRQLRPLHANIACGRAQPQRLSIGRDKATTNIEQTQYAPQPAGACTAPRLKPPYPPNGWIVSESSTRLWKNRDSLRRNGNSVTLQ
jgi:hypothetical protein